MAWFHDYSRDYDRATGYGRGRGQRDVPGMRSSSYGYDTAWRGNEAGWGSRNRWGTEYRGDDAGYNRGGYWGEGTAELAYGRDYLGRSYGYGSDYDNQYRRRRPEESPLYGRGADRAVQQWARRYGYDMQYEIDPDQGGGYRGMQRGYGGTQGGYRGGERHAGYAPDRGWGGRTRSGYGGYSGGYTGGYSGYGNRDYRF